MLNLAQQEGKRRSGHTWCGGFPSPATGPKKTWEARRRAAAVPDGRAPRPASPRPLAATTPRPTWCPSVWRREAPTARFGGGRRHRPDLEDGGATMGGGSGRVCCGGAGILGAGGQAARGGGAEERRRGGEEGRERGERLAAGG